MTENEIGRIIVDAALTIHREMGPGLLETVYEVIMAHELTERGLSVRRQVPITVEFRGVKFDEAFRADLVVEEKVIIELKSVEQVSQAHKKQLPTYLRLTRCKLGFVLNFGEALMKRGITRAVNGLEEDDRLRLGVPSAKLKTGLAGEKLGFEEMIISRKGPKPSS